MLIGKDDQGAAVGRIADLESAWDSAQPNLFSADCQAWTFLDQRIDAVLTAVRASTPDSTTEKSAITDLLAALPE